MALINRKDFLIGGLALGVGSGVGLRAWAQDFPTKPIRLVIHAK